MSQKAVDRVLRPSRSVSNHYLGFVEPAQHGPQRDKDNAAGVQKFLGGIPGDACRGGNQ